MATATREQIYNSIRAADAAGDSASVQKLGAYLKTMPPDVAAPTLADSAVHQSRLAQAEKDLAVEEGKGGFIDAAMGLTGNYLKGLGDTALNLATATIATPVAGLAGLATTAATAPFVGAERAGEMGANVVNKTSSALTYEPKSDVGKAAQENISKPFQMLANVGDKGGQVVADFTHSPALGSLANTAIQAAPAIFLRKGGPIGKLGKRAAGAAAEVEPSAVKTGGTPGSGQTAAPPPVAETAPPPPATTTAPPPTTAAPPPPVAAVEPPPVQRAKQYATDRMGVDWDSLPPAIRKKLTVIASDATNLQKLDPAALAREAKLGALPVPVPATRGQLMRDPVALRNEGNASATNAGRPIADIHEAANKALIENLDVVRGKVAGVGETAAKATTAEEAGGTLQGAARAKFEFQNKKVKRLYKEAEEAGEMQGQVSTRGLVKLLDETPDRAHLGYVEKWLDKMGVSQETGAASRGKRLTLSLKEMEDLRQDAVAEAMNPNAGRGKIYASKVIAAIDEATEGQGGTKYKEARAAYRNMKLEFEDQAAVADLVDNASRTDRATALEKTVKTIANGSLEDIRKVKRTLLTGEDAATRTRGKKAWRELRVQVIEDIKGEATKGVAPRADGTPNLTANGLQKGLDKYKGKLDELFGPGTTKQLAKIMDATKDVKTLPPSAAVGSSTFANVLAFLEKGLTKIPGGGTAADVIRGVAKIKDIGAAGREASQATVTPLNEALKKATNKATRQRVVGTKKDVKPGSIPLSQVGAEQKR